VTRRLSLLAIFVSMLVIGAGYASAFLPGGAPRLATYAFALATAIVMTAILTLGAARRGRSLGRLKWVFAFTFLVLALGFVLALMQQGSPTDRLYLGLPAGAAIILYIVGLLPMVVLPITYALTFEQTTMDEAELTRLREQLAELRSNPPADAVELRR
jgi:lysylphosphatidylglycerol synthetase-like protein (DUF2156 family)